MFKILFFLNSKVLDFVTPYIIVAGSDKVATKILLLTIVLTFFLYNISPMFSFTIMILGALFIIVSYISKLYILRRLIEKQKYQNIEN